LPSCRRTIRKPAQQHRSTVNDPIAQAFQQLAQDLQSGNLSGAQQDFSTIQQDIQSQGGGHHHHSYLQDSSAAQQNPIAQLFSELGQALQSGNLSAAQQAYTTLQQDFQSASGKGAPTSSSPGSAGVQTTA
jgi:outer membrane protein assembly factor BamD (BamD/ComL family)